MLKQKSNPSNPLEEELDEELEEDELDELDPEDPLLDEEELDEITCVHEPLPTEQPPPITQPDSLVVETQQKGTLLGHVNVNPLGQFGVPFVHETPLEELLEV